LTKVSCGVRQSIAYAESPPPARHPSKTVSVTLGLVNPLVSSEPGMNRIGTPRAAAGRLALNALLPRCGTQAITRSWTWLAISVDTKPPSEKPENRAGALTISGRPETWAAAARIALNDARASASVMLVNPAFEPAPTKAQPSDRAASRNAVSSARNRQSPPLPG
jgi:hypothetical protein